MRNINVLLRHVLTAHDAERQNKKYHVTITQKKQNAKLVLAPNYQKKQK